MFRRPWFYYPQRPFLPGKATLSGEGSITLADATGEGTGFLEESGSGAVTLTDDAGAGSGTVGFIGSGEPTLSEDIGAGSGAVETTGAGAPVARDDSGEGAAFLGLEASGAVILGADFASDQLHGGRPAGTYDDRKRRRRYVVKGRTYYLTPGQAAAMLRNLPEEAKPKRKAKRERPSRPYVELTDATLQDGAEPALAALAAQQQQAAAMQVQLELEARLAQEHALQLKALVQKMNDDEAIEILLKMAA